MREDNFQFVECHGTPRRMGQQYGEAARDAILTNLERRLSGGLKQPHAEYVERTRSLLSQHAPDVLEELKGLAEGSGASLEMLIVENAMGTPFTAQCTSMAIPTSPKGAVLGKNNDGEIDGRRWILRRSKPARGLPMLQILSAGWLSGLDSLNASGLTNGHNSVGSSFARVPNSIEIRLWTYHLMQRCSTVNEFAEGLLSIPLNGKGFNIVAADAGGNTRVFECAVPTIKQRGAGEPFVYATNHYMSDGLKNADRRTPDKRRISAYRYGYLTWQDQMHRPGNEEDIRTLLMSHEPWAPCRHGLAHASHTLWSMIAVPERHRLDVASGAPCVTEYVRYQL